MWLVGFRDLQWRRRRFLIAVLSTALLFSITLLLTGISASFHNEVRRTMNELDVDGWIVPTGTAGPFTTSDLFLASESKRMATVAGVKRADPMLLFHETIRTPKPKDLNVIGYTLGGVGQPRPTKGRVPTAPGEIVVDSAFGQRIGHTIKMGGQVFRIVGTLKGMFLGGIATGFVSVADAQKVLLRGTPLTTAVVTRGVPTGPLPPGYISLSSAAVRADLVRPLGNATYTISLLNGLLWIIAAGIMAAILYMSALERVREFAVIKAMGAANGFVVAGLASQAVVLALSAAIVAFGMARLIAPTFPLPVEIPTAAYAELLVVSVAVGLVGSVAGLRRVLAVDPAVAFRGVT